MTEKINKIFVYGTLMSDFINPASDRLRKESHLMGKVSLSGRLFDLGDYPGGVFEPASTCRIKGELYRLHDAANSLSWLDDYEDAGTGVNPEILYRRIQVPVSFRGRRITAWMYHYIKPVEGLKRIISGDYNEYLGNK